MSHESHVQNSLWLKDILPRTPGIVRAVAAREFVLAAREFYRDSAAWREAAENFHFIGPEYQYFIDTPDTEAEICRVLGVEIDGVPLRMTAERPQGERTTGQPTGWYPSSHDPHVINLWPTPDQYETDVIVRVQLIPSVTSVRLPHSASGLYYEALLDGVLGRLYAHPAKPYSNPTLGEYHLRRFRNAIGAAAGEAKQGWAAGQNWTYPRFGK